MSYEDAKLALSGGVASTPFLCEVFELAGTETPQIAFDGSPCVSQESLDKKRKMWQEVCQMFLMPEPIWLQDYVDEPLTRSKTNAILDTADVLYVTGGASRRAITVWTDAGVSDDILERVYSGDITAAGGSAGAMIWFEAGLSDSEFYDVREGENWEYVKVREAALFDAWVIAHYSDRDNLGRDKQSMFESFLRDQNSKWNYAIGIDTCAALICAGGLAQVRDITPASRAGQGLGANVYIHYDSLREPHKLHDGDTIPLNGL